MKHCKFCMQEYWCEVMGCAVKSGATETKVEHETYTPNKHIDKYFRDRENGWTPGPYFIKMNR